MARSSFHAESNGEFWEACSEPQGLESRGSTSGRFGVPLGPPRFPKGRAPFTSFSSNWNQARNWERLHRLRSRGCVVPAQETFVYAIVRGEDIGYYAPGQSYRFARTVEWTGWIPFERAAARRSIPEKHFIVSANKQDSRQIFVPVAIEERSGSISYAPSASVRNASGREKAEVGTQDELRVDPGRTPIPLTPRVMLADYVFEGGVQIRSTSPRDVAAGSGRVAILRQWGNFETPRGEQASGHRRSFKGGRGYHELCLFAIRRDDSRTQATTEYLGLDRSLISAAFSCWPRPSCERQNPLVRTMGRDDGERRRRTTSRRSACNHGCARLSRGQLGGQPELPGRVGYAVATHAVLAPLRVQTGAGAWASGMRREVAHTA